MRAVHVVSYEPEGLTKPGFVDAVRRIKADGATHVVLRPMLVTDSVESSEFEDKADAPTDATLAAGIDAAEREGVKSIIQPSLEPEGTYAGAYVALGSGRVLRGLRAAPRGVGGHRGRARRGRIRRRHDVLAAGRSGLHRALDRPAQPHPRALQVPVTYSAEDVEGAERIQFWDAADAIGVIHLAAMTDEPTNRRRHPHPGLGSGQAATSEAQRALEEARHPQRSRLRSRWMTRRPTALTEAEGEPSEEAQAALYEAAFRAFAGNDWFGGIAWSELNGDGGQPEPDDFSFAGKQAEEVLRAWQTAG